MQELKCYKCNRDLRLVQGVMPMYDGVLCKKCKKLECIHCKGSPANRPCSACGGEVTPAFAQLFQ